MAVVENGVVWPVGFLYLVQGSSDQECLDVVTNHESESGFKEIQSSEGREFVKHHKHAMLAVVVMQVFR